MGKDGAGGVGWIWGRVEPAGRQNKQRDGIEPAIEEQAGGGKECVEISRGNEVAGRLVHLETRKQKRTRKTRLTCVTPQTNASHKYIQIKDGPCLRHPPQADLCRFPSVGSTRGYVSNVSDGFRL